MDIRAETTIPQPRDAVFRVNRDKLVELVEYLPNVRSIEVQSRKEIGPGKVEYVNVWHGGGDLPAAVRAFLSENMLSWTDFATWDESTHTCAWRSESHAFREAVNSRGHNEFAELGAGRSTVRIVGSIVVDGTRIPRVPRLLAGTVGMAVEAFLIKQIQDNLDEIGRGVDRYLKERGPPPG